MPRIPPSHALHCANCHFLAPVHKRPLFSIPVCLSQGQASAFDAVSQVSRDESASVTRSYTRTWYMDPRTGQVIPEGSPLPSHMSTASPSPDPAPAAVCSVPVPFGDPAPNVGHGSAPQPNLTVSHNPKAYQAATRVYPPPPHSGSGPRTFTLTERSPTPPPAARRLSLGSEGGASWRSTTPLVSASGWDHRMHEYGHVPTPHHTAPSYLQVSNGSPTTSPPITQPDAFPAPAAGAGMAAPDYL